MKRVIARLIVAGALSAVALAPLNASANDWEAVCVVTVHFNFSAPVSSGGGSGPFTISGTGPCAVTGLAVPAAVRTISIYGDGIASNAKCAPLLISGGYGVSFGAPPAPPGGSGIFSFNGTASAGVLLMTDLPIFAGLGVGVGAGALDCAQGGATSLTFSVPLAIVDP